MLRRRQYRYGQQPGLWPNSPLGGSSWSLGSLSNLVQRFLDANPTYHAQAINSYPIITPEDPGTVAQPRGQRCVSLDGTNDYATVSLSLTAPTSGTLCGWIKNVASATGSRFIAVMTATRGMEIRRSATGVDLLLASNLTDYTVYSPGAVTLTSLTHVAFTFSGTTVKCYINGVDTALTPTVNGAGFSGTMADVIAFFLGANSAGGNFSNAYLSDTRYYSVAKSPTEVLAICNQASTPTTVDRTGLLGGWWLQEENVQNGGLHYDWSGNGKHLTATNITALTYNATDSGVTYNANNWFGYTLSGSNVIPANLSDLTKDFAGNALGVAGPVCKPVTTEVNCFTADGTASYVNCGTQLIPNGATSFVAEQWMYFPTLTSKVGGFSQGNTTNGVDVTSWSDGKLYVDISVAGVSNGVTIPLSGNVVAATWAKIRVDYDGSRTAVDRIRIYVNDVLVAVNVSGTLPAALPTISANTLVARDVTGTFSVGRYAGLSITTGGKTYWPLFDQCGPGSSNTNRDFYIVCSDGTATLVSGGIVNGTISAIYANRCPYVQDWSIQYGGSYNPNMLSYTEDFSNAYWVKVNGAVTAGKLVPTNANAAHPMYAPLTGLTITARPHTWSIEAKASGYGFAYFTAVAASGNTRYGIVVDLSTGSVTATGTKGSPANYSHATPQSTGGGWYRLSITMDATADANGAFIVAGVSSTGTPTQNADLDVVFTGDGINGVEFRNAQLELGTVATPYQANATIPNGSFIPGRIGSTNDAAGNAKTLAAGKFGNPYSRLNRNRWAAPELVNIGIAANDALAPSDAVQATSPADTKFRRSKADGSDRYFATSAALTGTDKTNAEGYVG